MKKITAYQTMDGVAHRTQELAKRHAESMYANQMSLVTNKALQAAYNKTNPLSMGMFFEENQEAILKLYALRRDMDFVD